jgi:glycine cleavage system regulatory protein
MNTFLVLTVIGDDKPGLVETLSRTVTDHGGNWLESRMSHMAGKFAGIVRVSAPETGVDELVRALEALESAGLRTGCERSASTDPAESFTPVLLELVGADHPGIVRAVSQALARRGVNVEELGTECSNAPMSGESLFRATARLRLPAGLALDELRQDLEQVAHSLMVDLTLGEQS